MGFFDSVKKAVSNTFENPGKALIGGGIGSALLGPAGLAVGAVAGGNMKGSLSDMFLGKKQKDIKPDEIANQIRSTQIKGIGELNSALDTPSADIVKQQVETQKKGVLTAAQDARRNAQRLMAQRGMKNSSLSLASDRSISADTGDRISSINAATPGLIRNQQIQDASTRIGVGGLGTPAGINFNTIEGQREGGILGIASALAPLAGSAASAYKDYQTGGYYGRRV